METKKFIGGIEAKNIMGVTNLKFLMKVVKINE